MLSAKHGFALVTPASRGLGFALAQQLLVQTQLPVIATGRKNCFGIRERLLSDRKVPANAGERLRLLEVDVTEESTIASMADTIQREYPGTPLRLALTVPGILHVEKHPAQIDAANSLLSFQVNALGPLLLAKHLTPFLPTKSMALFPESNTSLHLPSHAIYAMMAARVGSISDNKAGGWYSYRASKAAVFQLAKTLDLYLSSRSAKRAIAVALHPGTVRTDFTQDFHTGREMLEPMDSADRLLRILARLPADAQGGRGRCWDWKGEEVFP